MFEGITTIVMGILTILTAYLFVKIQILSNEKVFVEFKLQETKQKQIVRNISNKAAVNVKVYRVFLDTNTSKKRDPYKTANITLEYALGSILSGEKREIKLLPISDSYEIFVIEYQNISGETYQSITKPQSGRGDHEFLYVPRKIYGKHLDGILKKENVTLPRYMVKAYDFNHKTL